MEATVYPDSSFLVSLVCRDARSDEATRYMERAAQALVYTQLHRIEARNAIRNAAARGDITASEQRAAFRQIEADLQDGLLIHVHLEWTKVFRRADELSEKHAIKDGQRTIDLLHVAIALECGAKSFLTFDRRQTGLARAAGLIVTP